MELTAEEVFELLFGKKDYCTDVTYVYNNLTVDGDLIYLDNITIETNGKKINGKELGKALLKLVRK